ncbi:MAG: hypothetical protein GX787_02270 [Tissierellia bacterium]|nr:hypothetical protein [Tissierellia bacterium]
MDIIKDLIYINKSAFNKTIKSLSKNWIIIFTGIVYTILNVAIFSLISVFLTGFLSILSGIIVAIITAAFISNYLYLLFNIINYDRINMQIFKDGFKYYLWKIYGVLFIAYLGRILLGILSNMLGGLASALNIVIYLSILIVLNPLPETIYLKSYSSWESVLNTFEFMQENWINWLLPNIIFHGVLYFITGNLITNIFTTHLSFNMVFSIKNIIIYLVGQGLFSFIMVYRGHLYKTLSGSTRRKRMFMNKF